MNIEQILGKKTAEAIKILYNCSVFEEEIVVQKTNPEFTGDFTIVVFPLTKYSKKPSEQTAEEIGNYLKRDISEITSFQVIKGFLNLVISDDYWLKYFATLIDKDNLIPIASCQQPETSNQQPIVIEYSSPNTNKPLHLGHIRNNLIGYSLAEILKANGYKVIKVNLVNDRGIHICKSMLAYQKWGKDEEPTKDKFGLKGDALVGKYYVEFEKNYQAQVNKLIEEGLSREEAEKKAPLILEAQEMLCKWENKDPETIALWKKLNNWIYEGFDVTYKRLGVDFDKIYFESDTYLLGKNMINQAIKQNLLSKRQDGSVWIDLRDENLDEKLLIRSDGTSVYITQDLGTALLRYDEFNPSKMIYVVGNEQEHHFKVLKATLKKLGYDWYSKIYHLSYGMVELPHGRMKSRQGTVVDADDLIDEMIETARKKTDELGKIEGFTKQEAEKLYNIIGLGALKYFILKVDPLKNMLFNPEESIDFNGNTGPFIQYTYARIQSVLRKAKELGITNHELRVANDECAITRSVGTKQSLISSELQLLQKEKDLIKLIHEFRSKIKEAGETYNPAIIANYVYELAKDYNQFYQEIPILKEPIIEKRAFKIYLSLITGKIIKAAMRLLGIDVPDRM